MIGTFLFIAFVVMLLGAVPIGVALGLAGGLAIWIGGQSIMAMPTNVYTGIAKYPLIAIPMFVLVGSVFDRTGVALRLVRFATALVGAGRGALATVAMLVAMVIGGISGSGPATSAAVGGVVTRSMVKDGYPRPFIASVVGAAAATDILIPPSIAFIIYAVMTPGRFGAGDFRGRHVPRHPGRLDDADPDYRHLDDQGFWRQVEETRSASASGRRSKRHSGAYSRRW